jgi:octaprenyl-diphosphate synthase
MGNVPGVSPPGYSHTTPSESFFHSLLSSDLERVDREMRVVLASDVHLVDKVVQYLVRRKGKSLRPMITLLCARLFGSPPEGSVKIAVIVELLHTATLVHDDVVDDSPVRRGFPSLNAIWKNKVSVLVGDYLLAKAMTSMLEMRDFTILEVLGTTARRMSRGELLQIAKARKLDITEEVYFDMIADKTAALFSACCELAAITSGSDATAREQLRCFGEKLGLAFQIRDDVLDFEGRRSLLGKPTLGDVKERKITLPLIHALKTSQNGEGKKIRKLIERGLKTSDRERVLDFLRRYDGIAYAITAANRLRDEALACLAYFPDTSERRTLEEFTRFAVERKK